MNDSERSSTLIHMISERQSNEKARRDHELFEKRLQLRRHLVITDMAVVKTMAKMRFQRYARAERMLVQTISQAT